MSLSEKSNEEIVLLWSTSLRNPERREAIESEIRRRIPHNNGVSKERLFTIFRTHNRSVNIYFLPTTVSYNSLGEFITVVDLELNANELEELLRNVVNEVTTNGIMKCKKLNDTDDTEMTSNVEFNTNEISHIG